MRYEYKCISCKQHFETDLSIEDRDSPVDQPCPVCKSIGTVKRVFHANGISSVGRYSVLRRAGNEWNSILKSIKKGSGEKNTIETR